MTRFFKLFSVEKAGLIYIITAMKTKIILMIIACLFVIGCEPQQKESPATQTVIEQNTKDVVEPIQQTVTTEPANEPVAESVSEQAKEPEEGFKFEITMKILTVDKQGYPVIDGIWDSVTRGYVTADYFEILNETQLEIGMAWADFDEKLNSLKQKIKSAKEAEVKKIAIEGKPVYLEVGEKIACDKFFFYGKWYQSKDYKFEKAKKFLKIIPQRIPEREFINLQITVVFSDFLADGGDKEFSQMTAGITLKPMQPAVIGGPVQMDEFLGKALLTSAQNGIESQSLIVLLIKPLEQ